MPVILDLGEFCSPRSKSLPHLLCGGIPDLTKSNVVLSWAEVFHSAEVLLHPDLFDYGTIMIQEVNGHMELHD